MRPAPQMYKYAGADSGPEELRSFGLAGYKQARPLPVPPEPTVFGTMLQAIKRSGWTVRAVEVQLPFLTCRGHTMLSCQPLAAVHALHGKAGMPWLPPVIQAA